MRRLTKIVAVLVIAAVIIIGYMTFVGFTKTSKDIGPDKDPTGQARSPIAYAVFTINCKVVLGATTWSGSIKSIEIQSYPWINGTNTINQMYQQKLNPLGWFSSNFEGWITLRISGPGNYIPDLYTSPKQQVTQQWSDLSQRTLNFGPYTAKFYDPGQYSITATLFTEGDNAPRQMASLSQQFTITGGL